VSSAAAALGQRPGVVQGAQPERADHEAPWLARAVHELAGRAWTPRRVGRRELEGWVAQVETAGRGLEDLDESGFDAALVEQRLRMRRYGLIESLLPRGFALVREAARRALGTPHYGVQLCGGRVMARGGLAEMETGEGKTLTATLPAALAALAGIPVHVITANDYLVERDAESMTPLYERLGVRVGIVVERDPERAARRAAYACDITYVTNKQVAFDYLRDSIADANDGRLARRLGLDFGMPSDGDDQPVLRGLCFGVVDEADSVLIDDACTPLILSRPNASEDEGVVRQALVLADSLQRDTDYRVDRRRGVIELTAEGHTRLEILGRDLAGPLAGERRREEWVSRALAAEHLFERDRHYLVNDDAIEIIDLPTGRRAPDRAFEGGIQALIECREQVPITPRRETIARVSYQSFFRRYLRLCGMTGTAHEVSSEIWRVYGLPTNIVPTRLESRRRNLGQIVVPDEEARWTATVERIGELQRSGRPVLVGTSTVATSEMLSERLDRAGFAHSMLSARQDREEASVISRAGEAGRITVATRMAGRGTDIALGPGVEELGGLAVVSTEMGEARRIDRQLFGRCGRQGQPGTYEQILASEASADGRVAHLRWLDSLVDWMGLRRSAAVLTLRARQRAEERRAARVRQRLLASERLMGEILALSDRRT
jgi:preprotein translocase subunit SecA